MLRTNLQRESSLVRLQTWNRPWDTPLTTLCNLTLQSNSASTRSITSLMTLVLSEIRKRILKRNSRGLSWTSSLTDSTRPRPNGNKLHLHTLPRTSISVQLVSSKTKPERLKSVRFLSTNKFKTQPSSHLLTASARMAPFWNASFRRWLNGERFGATCHTHILKDVP
jgi:hypothetical protein